MSVYSSICSSSSSSSSSSSGSSSGSYTGSFSSASQKSFDSCASTIIATQPVVRPFGCPEYNYYWIENRSKSNPRLSYFYNYKSHAVVWQRPVPKDVPLPIYSALWVPEPKELSENDDDLIVSEDENIIQKRKRLDIKKRNFRLQFEDNNDTVQVLSVQKTIKNKKMLDVLWKLHRFPGESVEDVRKRILGEYEDQIEIKTERLSVDGETVQRLDNISIKQEIDFDNAQELPIDDSDSDPEHVSYLIKQEYLMGNYSDSELEDKEEEEEELPLPVDKGMESDPEFDEEEESSNEEEEEDDDECEELNFPEVKSYNTRYSQTVSKPDQSDLNLDNSDSADEESFILADFLDIEIQENVEENVSLQLDDAVNIDHNEEDVNWMFEKSRSPNDSTLKYDVLNPHFRVPQLKRMSCKISQKKKQKKKPVHPKVPKLIIKTSPQMHVKQEQVEDQSDQPIICDMYGTRTVNYNAPPKTKLPKWQEQSRLTDSEESSSDSESNISRAKRESIKKWAASVDEEIEKCASPKEVGALELKNWFPKKKAKKRKRNSKKSDSSWCDSNLSDYSDVDEFDKSLFRLKKEKRISSSDDESQESDSQADALLPIKKKEMIKTTSSPEKGPENERSLTSAVDLGLVKVERRSTDSEDREEIPSEGENNDDDVIVLEGEKKNSAVIQVEENSSGTNAEELKDLNDQNCSSKLEENEEQGIENQIENSDELLNAIAGLEQDDAENPFMSNVMQEMEVDKVKGQYLHSDEIENAMELIKMGDDEIENMQQDEFQNTKREIDESNVQSQYILPHEMDNISAETGINNDQFVYPDILQQTLVNITDYDFENQVLDPDEVQSTIAKIEGDHADYHQDDLDPIENLQTQIEEASTMDSRALQNPFKSLTTGVLNYSTYVEDMDSFLKYEETGLDNHDMVAEEEGDVFEKLNKRGVVASAAMPTEDSWNTVVESKENGVESHTGDSDSDSSSSSCSCSRSSCSCKSSSSSSDDESNDRGNDKEL